MRTGHTDLTSWSNTKSRPNNSVLEGRTQAQKFKQQLSLMDRAVSGPGSAICSPVQAGLWLWAVPCLMELHVPPQPGGRGGGGMVNKSMKTLHTNGKISGHTRVGATSYGPTFTTAEEDAQSDKERKENTRLHTHTHKAGREMSLSQ